MNEELRTNRSRPSRRPFARAQRLYLETLELILKNSSKVLVDTEGGNNLLYLPLDQLTRRGDSRAPANPSPPLSMSENRPDLDVSSSGSQAPRR